MANAVKVAFLHKLTERYGAIRKLEGSLSLYDIGDGAARIYVRYSRLHDRNQAFYRLREVDLRKLEGRASVICYLWDNQEEPLFIPFSEYEDVFESTSPASDGQYKVQVYLKGAGTELYIAGAGRFNVDAHFGWGEIEALMDFTQLSPAVEFSHPQIQTFLGAIGVAKGHDIWIPQNDRVKLEWSLADRFDCRETLPYGFESVADVIQEVDVIWIERGSDSLRALFEVEHSTPIYGGLFIHLASPNLHARFSIVANDTRRDLFARQLNRPTFRASGLGELCTFFEYKDVARWHTRIRLK